MRLVGIMLKDHCNDDYEEESDAEDLDDTGALSSEDSFDDIISHLLNDEEIRQEIDKLKAQLSNKAKSDLDDILADVFTISNPSLDTVLKTPLLNTRYIFESNHGNDSNTNAMLRLVSPPLSDLSKKDEFLIKLLLVANQTETVRDARLDPILKDNRKSEYPPEDMLKNDLNYLKQIIKLHEAKSGHLTISIASGFSIHVFRLLEYWILFNTPTKENNPLDVKTAFARMETIIESGQIGSHFHYLLYLYQLYYKTKNNIEINPKAIITPTPLDVMDIITKKYKSETRILEWLQDGISNKWELYIGRQGNNTISNMVSKNEAIVIPTFRWFYNKEI